MKLNYLYCILLGLFIACKKENASTGTPEVEQIFTLLFIGDSEPRMRDNTDEELSYYVQKLIDLKTHTSLYFDYGSGSEYRIDPEIILLGGDISADRTTSIKNDSAIWSDLYSNGILFLAGFGNHDWDPDEWSDGSKGYSLAGHLSNEDTKAFCKWTYQQSQKVSTHFSYTAVEHLKPYPNRENGGPRNFYAQYKGVHIVNFNTFLYQPSYYYPQGWPATCNILTGGAGCQNYVSAEEQIQDMKDLLPTDTNSVVLFFQHYPFNTSDDWWTDWNASGTTIDQKKNRLKEFIAYYNKSVFLAGHNHFASNSSLTYQDRTFKEYIAPYFGGSNGVDYQNGGGFYALLISNTRGVLEVKKVDPPL
ncbi:MAG: hypothetical protein K1X55_04975 [Chitinophagales bacterium]|nr:hypothetical protein [Chitinophagales bacterium]